MKLALILGFASVLMFGSAHVVQQLFQAAAQPFAMIEAPYTVD